MSAVGDIGMGLGRVDPHAHIFTALANEPGVAIVGHDGFTISGTPDQLLDLAALLVSAANLVYAQDIA